MKKILNYISLSKFNILSTLTYFKSFLLSKVFLVLILFILYQLYKTIFHTQPQFDGFTVQMMVYYITITESIELSKYRIYSVISEEIKDGTCAYQLIRPLSYISFHFFNSIGMILFNFFVTLFIGTITSAFLSGFNLTILFNIFRALPLIFMGIFLNFFIMLLIGLFGFYTEEVNPIYWIYQKILFVFGGFFFPLEFFPKGFQAVLKYLPTAYISYIPAKMAVQFTPGLFIPYFLGQVFYLCLIILFAYLIYQKGLKKLTINGG